MKTSNLLSALFFSLFVSTSLFAEEFKMKEEAYIPDIPFDTHEIYLENQASDSSIILPKMQEEAYIDDIPFNTRLIAAQHCCEKAMLQSFEMEEEAYINDIPFDTKTIAWQVLGQKNNLPVLKSTFVVRAAF